MRKHWKEYLFVSIAIGALFCIVLVTARKLGWPALFDSHVQRGDDFKVEALLCLILYRLIMYFSFPFIISLVEKAFLKDRFWHLVLRIFNIQFFVYSLTSGFYLLLGLDKYLGVEIFSSSEALMFLASFAFTLLLGKRVDNSLESKQ